MWPSPLSLESRCILTGSNPHRGGPDIRRGRPTRRRTRLAIILENRATPGTVPDLLADSRYRSENGDFYNSPTRRRCPSRSAERSYLRVRPAGDHEPQCLRGSSQQVVASGCTAPFRPLLAALPVAHRPSIRASSRPAARGLPPAARHRRPALRSHAHRRRCSPSCTVSSPRRTALLPSSLLLHPACHRVASRHSAAASRLADSSDRDSRARST